MADNYIETFTGGKFRITPQIDPDTIKIEDIAHALSNTCRYNGHCRKFYSVAEHSVYVSYLTRSKAAQRKGLLHDATEAYLNDIVSPFKQLIPEYMALEAKVWNAISSKFNLKSDDETDACVHHWDKLLVSIESEELLPSQGKPWINHPASMSESLYDYIRREFDNHVRRPVIPMLLTKGRILSLPPKKAEAFFIRRFNELFK